MRASARCHVCTQRTAAFWAAVLSFLGVCGTTRICLPADKARAERPPLSLHVWRYHYPNETALLAELEAGYERLSGRRLEVRQGEWEDAPRQIAEWMGRFNRYAPDMLVVQDSQLPLVLPKAVSLEARFRPDFLAQLYPGVLAQGRVQGVLTALPWAVRPLLLYYNSDVLAAKGVSPPTSPAELLEAARKLSDRPNMYGFGLPGCPGGGAADRFMSFFRAYGGMLFDGQGRFSLDGEAGHNALQLVADLVAFGATQPEVLSWSEHELVPLFLAGRVAMIIEGPSLLRADHSSIPFRLGVTRVPRVKGGCEHLRADCVVILDSARDLDGCVEFLQYALGPEHQRALARSGVAPVRRDAASALPKGEGWEVCRQALRDGRGPSPATWSDIGVLVEHLVYDTVSGRVAPGEAINGIGIDIVDEPEPALQAR